MCPPFRIRSGATGFQRAICASFGSVVFTRYGSYTFTVEWKFLNEFFSHEFPFAYSGEKSWKSVNISQELSPVSRVQCFATQLVPVSKIFLLASGRGRFPVLKLMAHCLTVFIITTRCVTITIILSVKTTTLLSAQTLSSVNLTSAHLLWNSSYSDLIVSAYMTFNCGTNILSLVTVITSDPA